MRTAAHHLLNLALAALGVLLAAAVAHTTARHGAAMWAQAVLGTATYAAATGAAGRILGTHPADAITDSITALIITTAAVITLAAAILTVVGRFAADHTTTAAGRAGLSVGATRATKIA